MDIQTIDRPSNVPAHHVLDFDIYVPNEDGSDIHATWQGLQNRGLPPIIWTPRNGGHWMVLKGPMVEEVLSDYENFSSYTVLVPKETAGAAYRLIPLSLDPPEHQPFRQLLNGNLSPKAVAPLDPQIRELTATLIDALRPKGECNFTHDFAEKLPVQIFMRLVDLPLEDLPKLKHLADQFTRPDGSLTYPEVEQLFREYIRPVIDTRRGSDRQDVLTRIINGQVNDRMLSDLEAENICIQLLVGGLDTVVNFMGFAMLFLAQHPDVRRELNEHPERISVAVMEFLRRFPLVASAREVKHDFTYHGVTLKQGDMVVAPTLLHGLDEAENPEAMQVDLRRQGAKHSSFGKGSHTCPGANLARLELKIMIEEWLRRIPDFQVKPGTSVSYGGGIVATVKPFTLCWDVTGA